VQQAKQATMLCYHVIYGSQNLFSSSPSHRPSTTKYQQKSGVMETFHLPGSHMYK